MHMGGEIYNAIIIQYLSKIVSAPGTAMYTDTMPRVIDHIHQKFAWIVFVYLEYVLPYMIQARDAVDGAPTFAWKPSQYFAKLSSREKTTVLKSWAKEEIARYNPVPTEYGKVRKSTKEVADRISFFPFASITTAPIQGRGSWHSRSIGLPWSLLPIVSVDTILAVKAALQSHAHVILDRNQATNVFLWTKSSMFSSYILAEESDTIKK